MVWVGAGADEWRWVRIGDGAADTEFSFVGG